MRALDLDLDSSDSSATNLIDCGKEEALVYRRRNGVGEGKVKCMYR